MDMDVDNQIKAFGKFQKHYRCDITFPIMDLDEYVNLVSNIHNKKEDIQKSKDFAKFSPEEILKIPQTSVIENSITYQVLEGIQKQFKEPTRYIGGYIPAPYTLVSLVLELQVASELMIFEPDYIESLIQFSTEIVEQYAALIKDFVDTFFILAPSECTIMKKTYIDRVQESMNRLIKYCVSDLKMPSIVHFCSKKTGQVVNEDIIKAMKGAGIEGLNIPTIIQNVDLAKKYDLVLCGGIDPISIQLHPFEKFRQQLLEILESTHENRYIFGTNCQVKWAPGQINAKELLNLFDKIKILRNK